MRLIPSFLAALLAATALAACGTKTPLTLPPSATTGAVAPAPTPAVDHNNKATAEPRQ
ncbi:MAG: lipoprotein [Sulfuritalea sp.]|nr:lipoprotein [Sulfuritalea sp.]MDP1982388.1 lipoprotein [Sulfuritalea sp.]